MVPEEEGEEQRLRAMFRQLQAESGVLERMVYKNKNQHRHAAYFQYLLKVRRDLKLLQSANLLEILNAMFPVISSRRPAHTVLVPARQAIPKPGRNHSYHERLLGVARLLSQIAEPVMKAAIQIPLLLAKSFFIQFSTMLLALLARIRVLVQQILLDVVSVFNKVSDLTDKKQSVKITLRGVQAVREYYPSSGNARTTLQCLWERDKFVLLEETKRSQKGQDMDQNSLSSEASIQYATIALFNEGQCLEKPLAAENKNIGAEDSESEKHSADENIPDADSDAVLATTVDSTPRPIFSELKPDSRKRVAFVSVGNPKSVAPERSSAIPNKKPRRDPTSPSPVESESPFGNLLGFDSTDRSIF